MIIYLLQAIDSNLIKYFPPFFLSGNIIHAKLEPPQVTDDEAVKQFILLERYNAVKLVQKIHHSLAAISKVIRGLYSW